jgi:hypothetical protein
MTDRKTRFENPKLPNFGCVDRFENLRCDFEFTKSDTSEKVLRDPIHKYESAGETQLSNFRV